MLHVWFMLVDVALALGVALYVAGGICRVESIGKYVNQQLSSDDVAMEAFPFKINDYNRDVQSNYPGPKGLGMSLNYPDDAIAYIVIYHDAKHAWNQAPEVLKEEFRKIQQHYTGSCFNKTSIQFIEANEMYTSVDGLRLPRIHTQTAGHVAGGAFYYQRHHVNDEPDHWGSKTIYGMSAHENFGLDTRFAGVIIFSELMDPGFVPRTPIDVAKTQQDKIKFLDEHNTFG